MSENPKSLSGGYKVSGTIPSPTPTQTARVSSIKGSEKHHQLDIHSKPHSPSFPQTVGSSRCHLTKCVSPSSQAPCCWQSPRSHLQCRSPRSKPSRSTNWSHASLPPLAVAPPTLPVRSARPSARVTATTATTSRSVATTTLTLTTTTRVSTSVSVDLTRSSHCSAVVPTVVAPPAQTEWCLTLPDNMVAPSPTLVLLLATPLLDARVPARSCCEVNCSKAWHSA